MARQFIAVEFKPGGRPYTYHNDGEPIAKGDRVRVELRGGQEQIAQVVGIEEFPPGFQTKPILGREADPDLFEMKGASNGQ